MDAREVRVGDFVVIRDWDDMVDEFGVTESGTIPCEGAFVPNMRNLCGGEYEIIGLTEDGYLTLSPPVNWSISLDMVRFPEEGIGLDLASDVDFMGFLQK